MSNQNEKDKKWEQENQVIKSKSKIPGELGHLINRERLLKQLEMSTEKVLIFQAGTGFGKTTVMAMWARMHKERSIWYRLHVSDNDSVCFTNGLYQSISRVLGSSIEKKEDLFLVSEGDILDGYDQILTSFFLRKRTESITCAWMIFRLLRMKRYLNLWKRSLNMVQTRYEFSVL